MPINPSKSGSALNNPTQRANELNDPQFEEQQGYFPYDLTHGEYLTPRFGEVTPSLCFHTVPGDRLVNRDNTKTILNQINGNCFSTINHYIDTFFVPLRSMYSTNYEKLFPNPTKGDDLPNSALPQFPIDSFVRSYFNNPQNIVFTIIAMDSENSVNTAFTNNALMNSDELLYAGTNISDDYRVMWYRMSRMALLATMLSRGQLLDYLGCQFDNTDSYTRLRRLQPYIDEFFLCLWDFVKTNSNDVGFYVKVLPTIADYFVNADAVGTPLQTLPQFRDFVSTAFERGEMMYVEPLSLTSQDSEVTVALSSSYNNLRKEILSIFSSSIVTVADIDSSSDPFRVGFINISPCLAYQQVIAQYYTNNTVDNIFTADLYMELLRSVMFPSVDGVSGEPTFDYNGVSVEYDYITPGAVIPALVTLRDSNLYPAGITSRQYLFITLMFLMRRSLRYGDYFSTARPNMLAVGQLSIAVDGNAVSPIDVTKNLLMQRYLNAANYIGSGELPYFASIFGVTPSDTGTYPRFISHRKIELKADINTNLAGDQGKQMTNFVGFSDDNAFDVFIDDFGIVLSLQSFDVLPVYDSGIDSTYHLSDRFDYFNPMLQNIGDQPIFLSEFIGLPNLHRDIFGYTMRNSEYKFKVSRAHGAFTNSLPGFLLKFPLSNYVDDSDGEVVINPEFIRDKPYYLDSLVPVSTGVSPAQYFHFVVATVNQLHTARKIQATPPVLF